MTGVGAWVEVKAKQMGGGKKMKFTSKSFHRSERYPYSPDSTNLLHQKKRKLEALRAKRHFSPIFHKFSIYSRIQISELYLSLSFVFLRTPEFVTCEPRQAPNSFQQTNFADFPIFLEFTNEFQVFIF